MKSVYLLWSYDWCSPDSLNLIGVYKSEESAKSERDRLNADENDEYAIDTCFTVTEEEVSEEEYQTVGYEY